MRVLVAGASGAIGLPTVRALMARGHQVTGVARTAANRRLLEDLGAVAVVADAMDADSIGDAVAGASPEVVVDLLAAVPKGGAWGVEDMEATNRLRINGTPNLLNAAVRARARPYVGESSYLVYGSGDSAANR